MAPPPPPPPPHLNKEADLGEMIRLLPRTQDKFNPHNMKHEHSILQIPIFLGRFLFEDASALSNSGTDKPLFSVI